MAKKKCVRHSNEVDQLFLNDPMFYFESKLIKDRPFSSYNSPTVSKPREKCEHAPAILRPKIKARAPVLSAQLSASKDRADNE